MSEEQNHPVSPAKDNNGQGNGQQKRNHHRNHHRKKPNTMQQAPENRGENAGGQNQPLQKESGNNQVQKKNRQNNAPGQNAVNHPDGKKFADKSAENRDESNRQNPSQKKGKNRHRNHNKGNGENKNRQMPPRMITDPYGIPSPQDQKILDELRAKIVLKAADGSIPSEMQTQKKPKEDVKIEPIVSKVERTAFDLTAPVSAAAAETENTAEERSSEELFADPAVCKAFTKGEDTVEVIGIRFRASGKVYFFDPNGLKMKLGDHAIVETARGIEFGDVTGNNRFLPVSEIVAPLRPVIRLATPEDVAQNEENRKSEESALEICQKKIEEHKLDMQLLDAQYAFDRSKLIFYFTSENRVDFRELVRDLAGAFHTRIDLRQIGIRDEAKMLGGLGACGRPLCCSSFLSDFVQVTMKMAKEQGLSLNSSKISGVCGRLMCCLRYESDVYAEEIRLTPSVDSVVRTPEGTGKVIANNPLAGTVRVLIADGQETVQKVFAREQVVVLEKAKKNSDEKKDSESEKG